MARRLRADAICSAQSCFQQTVTIDAHADFGPLQAG
jgi:hypothetical protein